jgi:MoaA/NifB/PqqE/SkfB family radical SAM enzyme
MSLVFLEKVYRILMHKADAAIGGWFFALEPVLEKMRLRPYELHLELTNVCNAVCIFCPYQFQKRPHTFMSDDVFYKAVGDFVACGGGGVGLTPIVGDSLIDPKFLERLQYLRSMPAIDRIWVTTNGILLDKVGIEAILDAGISSIAISTSGFEQKSYERIFQSKQYTRMRDNVLALLEANTRRGNPVMITIALRTDRPLNDVMKDPDFQPILKHKPLIDFAWSYMSAGGRITRDMLPAQMKLRSVGAKKEPCVNIINSPYVLADGRVIGCSCVAAMDAVDDLLIGDIGESSLVEIWRGPKARNLLEQFRPGNTLNDTCEACDMYRDLSLYRTSEGRKRAEINVARHNGKQISRGVIARPFAGG